MNRELESDIIESISEKITSIYGKGKDYYLIEFESGRKCYYEDDDAKEFQIGDVVQGIINHGNSSETYYPLTLENISYIERKGQQSLDEILNNCEIYE